MKFERTFPMMNAEQADVARKLTIMKKRTFLSKKYKAYNRSCRMTLKSVSISNRFNEIVAHFLLSYMRLTLTILAIVTKSCLMKG